MSAENQTMRVEAELRRRFRLAGRGSISRVEAALRLGQGYFRDRRRHGQTRINSKILLRSIAELEVEPGQFFAAVVGGSDPVAEFRTEAAALKRRLKRSPRILGLAAERDTGETETAVERIDLIALDARRDDDPREVMQQIKLLIPRVADDQVAPLLGIYGNACQVIGHRREAQIVLARALELALADGPSSELGSLLLRCASVAGDHGRYRYALALAKKAAGCYLAVADRLGIGKALAKMGMAWGCMDEVECEREARAFRRALDYLPSDSDDIEVRRNRFSCLVSLAITRRKQGRLAEAEQFARQAQKCAAGIGRGLVGKLIWFQASLAKERRKYAEAEAYFRQALDCYRDLSPLTTALLAVEVVRIEVLRGRRHRARTTAKTMAALLGPLEHNELAAAAITELIRVALSERGLSLAFLDRMVALLEKKGARPADRAS